MRIAPSFSTRSIAAVFATLTAFGIAGSAIGCVDDNKNVFIPPLELDSGLQGPPVVDAAVPPPVIVDAAFPIPDAGLDAASSSSSFATGLGAGAVVTKSAKYTLITKTGGSPGGHGVGRSTGHTVVSGAAANAKK